MSCFISFIAFFSHHVSCHQYFLEVIKWVQRNELIHVVFATEVFFEVAIERRPEWDSLPTVNEFHSDAVNDWGIKPWVQVAFRANFVELLQWDHLFRVIFHFGQFLRPLLRFFSSRLSSVNHMSTAERAGTYGIHQCRIPWSRYRKLDWVGCEPTITEFGSDALIDWAIRQCVHLPLRPKFVQLFQLQRLFSVIFHYGCCFPQSLRLFSSRPAWGNDMSAGEWAGTYGIHHWWILRSRYRKLDQMGFEPTITEFRSDALTDRAIWPCVQLALTANLEQLLKLHRLFNVIFDFGHCLLQSPRSFSSRFFWGSHMSIAEWADTYDIEHWRFLWSRFRKLDRVGFEPTIAEFRWDPLIHWAIEPWDQLALRVNFLQLVQLHRLFNVTFHFGRCSR